MDLRCRAKKHAELEQQVIEIKCNSDRCGAKPGVVVIHRWDASTGVPLPTKWFKDPGRVKQ